MALKRHEYYRVESQSEYYKKRNRELVDILEQLYPLAEDIPEPLNKRILTLFNIYSRKVEPKFGVPEKQEVANIKTPKDLYIKGSTEMKIYEDGRVVIIEREEEF